MGGFGALMNIMRTRLSFFGLGCSFNGALYAATVPGAEGSVETSILTEQEGRRNGLFSNCSLSDSPPFTYFVDSGLFGKLCQAIEGQIS